jgi:hypothetical protein
VVEAVKKEALHVEPKGGPEAPVVPITLLQTEKAPATKENTDQAAVSSEAARNRPEAAPETKTVARAEKPPEDREITQEDYEVAKGSRVETSAWHRIEIDEKTGKPVDNPELAYGKEFKREKAQEVLKKAPVDDNASINGGGGGSAPSTSMLGGLVTSLAAKSTEASPYEDKHDADLTVERVNPEHEHLTAGNELLRYASKPLTWIIAGVIVLGLFLLGILR